MARLALTPELLTGIPEIDEQHRTLVRWANLLLEEDADPDLVRRGTDFLVRYTDAHFRSEEFAMKLLGYDAHAQHLADHDLFRESARALADAARRGASTKRLQETASALLVRWVTTHIGTWDAAFARFLAQDPAARPSSAMPRMQDLDPSLEEDPPPESAP